MSAVLGDALPHRGPPEPEERPWIARVPWAEIRLNAAWPFPPSALRGAVVDAMGGAACHVDWHGHGPGGENLARPAPVYYRRDPARIVLIGDRAHDHVADFVRHVDGLRDPAGAWTPVEPQVEMGVAETGITVDSWHRYELRTPLFPPDIAWLRRPREQGVERLAWAGQLLAGTLRAQLALWGVVASPHQPVHVHVADMEEQRVVWEREKREQWTRRAGFVARFVANVKLPPGLALGRHRAEGFGELQHVSSVRRER